ncbi:inositol monophosphatase [Candidatus Daviesbacteria bacterium]|nr:inositol monophosphatase [Candidatus Daviesbacteria bacterium]
MKDEYLKVAKQAALEAGEIIFKYFGKEHKLNYKNNDKSDFTTQADLQAEEKIVQILTQNFPESNIIAEESGRIQGNCDYTWVIDPLDGTFSFSIGMPYFAVSIGLLKGDKPILGVIYHVLSKDLYWAEVGSGAFVNKKIIIVSKRASLDRAGVILDYGHLEKRALKTNLYILPLINKVGHVYSIGSAAMSMVLVGKGIQDALINQAWIWDFAAGAVIIEEAGGKVTDFEGKEIDWTKDRLNIIASNGVVHEQIIKALEDRHANRSR